MRVQSWDTAIKAGAGHDFSVCLTFEQAEEGAHRLIDCWRARVEYPALKRAFIAQAQRHQPQAILVEDKASGQSLIQDMRREGNWPIIARLPKGDKVTRVARITPMLEAGKVALPHYAHWLADFESELLQFPQGAHDDQVDALAQYMQWLHERQWDGVGIRSV